jgi:hypothetical protein
VAINSPIFAVTICRYAICGKKAVAINSGCYAGHLAIHVRILRIRPSVVGLYYVDCNLGGKPSRKSGRSEKIFEKSFSADVLYIEPQYRRRVRGGYNAL